MASSEYPSILSEVVQSSNLLIVGKKVERIDGLEKVTGKAFYTTDNILENALNVLILRSPYPHALIKRINIGAIAAKNVVITASDIPGVNEIGYYVPDQPLLVDKKARYVGDAVALVAAPTIEEAAMALEDINVEYEVLPALLDVEESLKTKEVRIHENGNVAGTVRVLKGDVSKAFSEADVVVENTYKTGYQDHAYIEPEAAIAIPEGNDKLLIIGTTQNPFRTRDVVAKVLGWNNSRVRVVVPYIGGGFGGKDTMGPLLCSMVALVAAKTGQPAILEFSRSDSLKYHFKRAPFKIHYKTAADKTGRLMAVEVDYTVDVGAYATQGLALMRRAAYHATGPYEVPNVKVHGTAVYTNKVPIAAFNGFGNPEMLFAAESQLDIIAEELGLDPVEIRVKNALVKGSRTGTNQLLDHSVGIKELIEKVADAADWKHKKTLNGTRLNGKRYGIGVGCGWHGCGTTGVKQDWAGASIIINPDGSVIYRTGIVELGQGTHTGHAMMVAEVLGIPLDWVKVERVDTSSVPDSGETHAQRGLMIGGSAAVDAALRLRQRLVKLAAEILECNENDVVLRNGRVYVKDSQTDGISFAVLAKEMYMRGISPAEYGFVRARRGVPDPETSQGEPYAAYSFSCCIAEVEVDEETGMVEVKRMYTGVDAGRIVNPEMVKGQLYGCAMMGIGFALTEKMELSKSGKIRNKGLGDYLILGISDQPFFADPIYVEDPYLYSGFGAKGAGEVAMNATPAAIINAVKNAIGIRMYEIPATAEKIYFAVKERKGEI
jgi:CO/xanthine dehydrogenase Mo-binding subunit